MRRAYSLYCTYQYCIKDSYVTHLKLTLITNTAKPVRGSAPWQGGFHLRRPTAARKSHPHQEILSACQYLHVRMPAILGNKNLNHILEYPFINQRHLEYEHWVKQSIWMLYGIVYYAIRKLNHIFKYPFMNWRRHIKSEQFLWMLFQIVYYAINSWKHKCE